LLNALVQSASKAGGDACSVSENKMALQISVPAELELIENATELSTSAQQMTFEGQINQHVGRGEAIILQENMQNPCSLVLGQCAELLRAKVKQSSDSGLKHF
jgi:hypothetical protein